MQVYWKAGVSIPYRQAKNGKFGVGNSLGIVVSIPSLLVPLRGMDV